MTSLIDRFSTRSDLHQSPMHAQVMQEIGWHVDGPKESRIYYRVLGPLAVAKIQRPATLDLDWINTFRKKHHVLTTYIEPGLTNSLPVNGLGYGVEPFAHSCTSLIDISLTKESILQSFTQKTRYNIVHSQKSNVIQVQTYPLNTLTKDLTQAFFDIHKEWSAKKNVVGYPEYLLKAILKCHKDTGDLHLAYLGDKLVGSLLILYHDRVATYYAAFALPAGYKNYAPTLLTWQALLSAKSRGCDIFDFGGIYDPRYHRMYKNWQGFTKFKQGFNPTVISYPPTTLKIFW